MSKLSTLLWFYAGRWLEHRDIPVLAESCYRKALEGKGRLAAEAGFRLGKRLLDRDSNRDAVEITKQALSKAPRNARLWCSLGAAERKLARMPAARDAYEKAIEYDSNYRKLVQSWEWHLASAIKIGFETSTARWLLRKT